MIIYPKVTPRYPAGLEREYSKILRDYVREEMAIIRGYVPEMVDAQIANGIKADERMDNWITDITAKISRAVENINIRPKIERMFDRVKIFAHKENNAPYKKIFGVTPKDGAPREYEVIKTIWTSQNLTLIKSIDSRTMEAIHYTLAQNVIRAARREEMTAELVETIKKLGDVSENRAVLIASDQVGKLNSQLTQYEQQRQGIDSYIWVTMGDSRVRPQHRERSGKRYYWKEPPEGGHPGYAIRCRCTAAACYDTDKVPLKPTPNTYKAV